jgi:hypothetical protein
MFSVPLDVGVDVNRISELIFHPAHDPLLQIVRRGANRATYPALLEARRRRRALRTQKVTATKKVGVPTHVDLHMLERLQAEPAFPLIPGTCALGAVVTAFPKK